MSSPDNQGGDAPSATPLDRVGELLKEREQYEQWIAALEAKKDRTPPHVYDRVRGDYERRLKEVLAEIGGHAGELRQALDQARERHARLAQQESTRRDERAEMELRHLVGEYTEEQWRVLSSRTDTEIQQLAESREAAKRALAQLEDVVRVATPAQSVGTVGPSAAGSAAPQPGSSQFDELAFLKSVVGPQKSGRGSAVPAPADTSPLPPEFHVAAGAAPPPSPAPPAPAAPAPPPAPPVAAAPAPVRYATPVGQMPLQPPLPAPQPSAPSRPTPAPPAEPVGAGAGAKASPETGKVPAFLKDVPTESVKTLKCRDCGTMNLPTEWYCERCGGELADIS